VTFEEQVAELARLEAVAKSLGLSDAIFDRILLEVSVDAQRSSAARTPAQTLNEIRRRIYAPLTREPGAGAYRQPLAKLAYQLNLSPSRRDVH
jgi:hypothetical protein